MGSYVRENKLINQNKRCIKFDVKKLKRRERKIKKRLSKFSNSILKYK